MTPALSFEQIFKSFDGIPALLGAELAIATGEVHALLGENGAGKSSLMNVAAGLYAPDRGTVRIGGRPVAIAGPAHARALGIGMVHQHFKLVKPFTAIENIRLANAHGKTGNGAARIRSAIQAQAEALGFDIDLQRPVGLLSIAEQQRVEILKVLVGGTRILILDEPTAVLTDSEADRLLTTMRGLAANGTAVVLVTHKLREVHRFADRVTVMRGGTTVATADPKQTSAAELTMLVVGTAVTETRAPADRVGEPLLAVSDLAAARADGHAALTGASFAVRIGEIYGIAGVGGNGQTELAEILAAIKAPRAGRIALRGRGDITATSPAERRALGFVAIPSDRQTHGLAQSLSVAQNFGVADVLAGKHGTWLRVDRRALGAATARAVETFDVRGVRSPNQKAALLSGGNAQKLVLARELSGTPRIVLAHSPSRGLDVRAAAAVHRRLKEARAAGAGVLLISEDLDEVMLLADRIGVMTGGRIVREFAAPCDRQAVGRAMVGHD